MAMDGGGPPKFVIRTRYRPAAVLMTSKDARTETQWTRMDHYSFTLGGRREEDNEKSNLIGDFIYIV